MDASSSSAGRETDAAPTIVSIQILRGVAAMLVVCHHYSLALPRDATGDALAAVLRAWWMPFRFGVDIFFIISGFVIMAQLSRAAPPGWSAFLTRRVTRIYPLYWLATLTLVPSVLLDAGLGSTASTGGVSIWLSLALWPQSQTPLLGQAWSLVHEMVFYLVITAVLAAGLRRHVVACVGILTLLALAQSAAGVELGHGTFLSLHLVEFLAGMVVFRWRDRVSARTGAVCGIIAAVGIAAVGIANSAAPLFPEATPERVVLYGGPALLVVLSALGLERCRAPSWLDGPRRLARRLGDTSYSIYLFHQAPIAGFAWVAKQLSLSPPAIAGWALLTLPVGILYGVAVGLTIERPLQQFLQRRLRTRAPASPVSHQRRHQSTALLPFLPPQSRGDDPCA